MQRLELDALLTLRTIREISTLPPQEAAVLLHEKCELYSLAYNQRYKKTLKQLSRLSKSFRKP